MVEYARAAAAHEVSAGLEVLPGVEALLAAIEGAGVERAVSCLVTGNLEDIAWAKMRALGVEGRFSAPRFGGFGSVRARMRARTTRVRVHVRARARAYVLGCVAARVHVRRSPLRPSAHTHTESRVHAHGRTRTRPRPQDARDRAELVAAAASRCASAHAAPGARFHLGDTPNDVRAAEACGATPIALLTGVFGEAELRASSKAPDDLVVLEDLADTDAVMSVLGLNA